MQEYLRTINRREVDERATCFSAASSRGVGSLERLCSEESGCGGAGS